jgi:hypothetical protein
MSRMVIKSLIKQLKQVTHQPVLELVQEQDEQQMQPTRNEYLNASNMDATQRGEVDEQHQNVT